MEIKKEGKVVSLQADDAEMEAVNEYTVEPLTAENVFLFRVVACGNDVDRDWDAFTAESLTEMANLFLGKPVIFDHRASAEGQVARIYRTQVVDADGITKTGERYRQLIAYCYIPAIEKNKDLIAEIKAGIKKEVSVRCAVEQATCSICGKDYALSDCPHYKGEQYGELCCYCKLDGASDAYELSFVAIPAQPEAGVIKKKKTDPEKQKPVEKKTVLHKMRKVFLH